MQIEPVSILPGGLVQYNSAEVWFVDICELSKCLPLLVPTDVPPVLAVLRLNDGHLLPTSGFQAIILAGLSELDSLDGGGGTPPGLLLDDAVDDESLLLLQEDVPGLLVVGDEHGLLVVGVP